MPRVITCSFHLPKRALPLTVILHRKITICYIESYRRILNEVRIHKYTHINHKVSALNIKYYKFDLNFDI
jgi:hypothetical protein